VVLSLSAFRPLIHTGPPVHRVTGPAAARRRIVPLASAYVYPVRVTGSATG
jgi:hypothetical protein